MSNAGHDRVADGINHVFSILTPEWRKVAYEMIADHGNDQDDTAKILAAVLGLQANVQQAHTQHPTTSGPADLGGRPGSEAGQAPAPAPLPCQPHPPTTHATTSTCTESENDDEHKE